MMKAIFQEKKNGNSLIDQRNCAHAQNSIGNAVSMGCVSTFIHGPTLSLESIIGTMIRMNDRITPEADPVPFQNELGSGEIFGLDGKELARCLFKTGHLQSDAPL
jgi:hypothetical protein